MRQPQLLERTTWRKTKDYMHNVQAQMSRWYGRPRGGMLTDLTLKKQRVIFIHVPKCGGTSLGKLLHVKRLSHALPREVLREKSWLAHYSIATVRNPFDRFLSSYYSTVLRPDDNGLTKRYGRIVKELDPFEYLHFCKVSGNNPPQVNWTHYPSHIKPQADLVLRFEEISDWINHMESAGLDVQGRVMHHHNKSGRTGSNHLEKLKLSHSEFERLKDEVRSFYEQDYVTFGYT